MKPIILGLAMCFATVAKAQQTTGILFEPQLGWQQIKEKAKAENKYIFIDCYATWCVPCKEMDNRVYNKDSIGRYVNEHFISLGVQFDSTISDNEYVRSRYVLANDLMREYKITAFPSYLFFSPDGRIVHRDLGYKYPGLFMQLVKTAQDPSKQVYTLLDGYRKGERNDSMMFYLVTSVKNLLRDPQQAGAIAQDYMQRVLYKLPDSAIYNKDNLSLIGAYLQSSDEKGFELFYRFPEKVDRFTRPGYAGAVTDFIITREQIDAHLYKEGKPVANPAWKQWHHSISGKYTTKTADRVTINAQIYWARRVKNYDSLVRYSLEKIDRFGLDTAGDLGKTLFNNMVWEVFFLHSEDSAILTRASQWMHAVIQARPGEPSYRDTYANLLYKLGRREEAIATEREAERIETENAARLKMQADKIYSETIARMMKGEITWKP